MSEEFKSKTHSQNENLRSEPAGDFISTRPPFLIRRGISIIFIILVTLIGLTWFIHYPEIIPAPATLISSDAPKEIIAKTDGRISKLFIKQNESVLNHQVIAFMESTANHSQVLKVSAILDSVFTVINDSSSVNMKALLSGIVNVQLNLGELQEEYQVFKQSYQRYTTYLSSGFYSRKIDLLYKDAAYLSQLNEKLKLQKKMIKKDEMLAETTFYAFKKLAEQKVISPLEYRQEESKALSKRQSIPSIDMSLLSNQQIHNDKDKEIAELQNEVAQQKLLFTEALNTFRSKVDNWKKIYVIQAPAAGKVSYSSFLEENRYVAANTIIGYVVQGNTNCFVEMIISQTNFGKIEKGQAVILKFDAYPYQQFGAIKGQIDYVSDVPNDNGFLAKVILPANLETTFKKKIQLRSGLKAQGEIITTDLRLPEYLIYNLRKGFNR